MRGFVVPPQNMSGRKRLAGAKTDLLAMYTYTSGSGTITAPRNCWAYILLWGPGGSGSTGGGGSTGGSGGAVLFKKVRMSGGQALAYALGTPGAGVNTIDTNGNTGTASTVTLPGGEVLSAGGGSGGGRADGVGVATGGDYNVSGSAPSGGGANGNGGAAGDISSFVPGVTSGAAGTTSPPAAGNSPGGGSRGDGSNTATGAGGNPQIIVAFVRSY